MSGPVTPPLTVSDVADGGSVTGRPITTIEVTDGTLTVSGRTATITTGGGGGSGTVTSITAAADSGSGTAITTSGTFTFTGSTGITTSVSGTTVTIVADNNGDVTAVATPVDNQLAVWTSATSIEGDANLTWDGSTLTVAGALDIDNIKIDGNTISSTDTDGAIDLSPDGAGTVTMYNAYRFPTAVTAANDYALVAQTDGTTAWAEVTATVPDPLQLSAGSAAAPTYSFSGDTDTGFFLDGSNGISMTGGGARQMTFQPNGLLRLGDGTNAAQLSTYSTNLVIDTDAGTDSGSITLQQGADQDILIEPDGTGIISFYTGANAWTIENGQGGANQVLTTDGAGAATWEDAAGGGTAGAAQIIGVPYGFNSGTDMAMLNRSPFGTIKTAAKSWSQSGCQCYPFIARKSGVIDTATLYVSATGGTTTGTLDFGIYSDSAGVPNAKLGECSFDPTTASQQTETVDSSVTTVAGSQYWAVLVPNGTDANPSIYANNLTYEMGLGVHSSTFGEGNPVLRSSSDTTLPASFTASNLAPSDFPRYGLGVKYT